VRNWPSFQRSIDHGHYLIDLHAWRSPETISFATFVYEKAAGRLSDKTWYDAIMSQGRAYAATGAVPDQYVIESWISLPKQALPDSADYSYTRSVRDFTRQFVQRAPATK